jgi:hypothetical protein
MAKKLALLLVLWDQLDSKKKIRAYSCVGTSGAALVYALKRAFKDLNVAYKKSLGSYCKTKRTEASKSIHLPTLDRQLKGPLLQYKFPWNKLIRDQVHAPVAGIPSQCLLSHKPM